MDLWAIANFHSVVLFMSVGTKIDIAQTIIPCHRSVCFFLLGYSIAASVNGTQVLIQHRICQPS